MNTPTEKPLDPVQQWMVKENIERAKREGTDNVVAHLDAQGYHLVAAAVRKAMTEGK